MDQQFHSLSVSASPVSGERISLEEIQRVTGITGEQVAALVSLVEMHLGEDETPLWMV